MTKEQFYLRVLAARWREAGHHTAADIALHLANQPAMQDPNAAPHEFTRLPRGWHNDDHAEKVISAGGMPVVSPIRDGTSIYLGLAHSADGEHLLSVGLKLPQAQANHLLRKMAKEKTLGAAEGVKAVAERWHFPGLGKRTEKPHLNTTEPDVSEQDTRPNEMLPEDYHSYGRKRKYARYSEVAKHPDVMGLMGQLDRDRGLHGVLADRIEELGFPEIAAHVRENPQPGSSWESPVATVRPEHQAALAAGQPYAMWWPVSGRHEKAGQRVVVMLGLPHKTDSYRSFTSEVMGRPQAAAKLRGLAADGVAVHTVTRSRPHNVRLLNTDESAARRLARLRYAAPAWWPRTGWGGRPGKEPITHEKVNAWLGKKNEKQLSRNRKVWRDHTGDIHLRLHYTNIVTWHPDGSYTLNTGGWHSPTTARNMAAVIGLPVQRVNKRGQPPQLGVLGKPIVDGAKWELPQAPEQDWRPDSMMPEDHYSLSRRKRRFARYSEVAQHPDVLGLMARLDDDTGMHGVLADRIEEAGFPGIALHIRESGHKDPYGNGWPFSTSDLYRHLGGLLEAGQPVAAWYPAQSREGGGMGHVHLFVPAGDGRYRRWSSPRLSRPQMAARLRSLSHDGVAISPGGARLLNTDESAAKRSRRKYAQKKPRTADFLTAVRVLRGSGQKRLHAVAEDIARGLGLAPAKTRDALLDGPRGALPGVAQAVAGADPHTARYAAAWYGLLARTPSLGLFHVRPDGPDSLYKFHVRGSAHTARRVLDRHGIAARVLLPHGAGYDVVVPDPGRRMRANTLKAAGHLGGRVEESVGHLEPLGHADPAQARSAFRKIVERYEGGRR